MAAAATAMAATKKVGFDAAAFVAEAQAYKRNVLIAGGAAAVVVGVGMGVGTWQLKRRLQREEPNMGDTQATLLALSGMSSSLLLVGLAAGLIGGAVAVSALAGIAQGAASVVALEADFREFASSLRGITTKGKEAAVEKLIDAVAGALPEVVKEQMAEKGTELLQDAVQTVMHRAHAPPH